MNSNQILGFCVPTCYPDIAFEDLFSDRSLENLKPLRKVMKFLINFQSPWTENLISDAVNKLKNHDFSVKYTFNEYKVEKRGYIPFNKIRNDCAELEDCAFYALIDDDFTFNNRGKRLSGIQYLEALHYMTFHEKCGILSFRNKIREFEKPLENNHISITPLISIYGTWLGMFFRSMKGIGTGNLFPKESLDLLGGGEEKILAAYRLYNGLYPARTTSVHVQHRATKNFDKYNLGWLKKDVQDANINKFIRENYNENFDRGGLIYNFVADEDYISKGGIMYDEKSSKELDVDYSIFSQDELESEIIEYWSGK